jgi:heat-inducible transcriptional repressor
MDKNTSNIEGNIAIRIGEENEDQKFSDYSLISKKYEVGQIGGTLGIVGPKRMEYSKVVAAVVYVAEQLSKELKKTNS